MVSRRHKLYRSPCRRCRIIGVNEQRFIILIYNKQQYKFSLFAIYYTLIDSNTSMTHVRHGQTPRPKSPDSPRQLKTGHLSPSPLTHPAGETAAVPFNSRWSPVRIGWHGPQPLLQQPLVASPTRKPSRCRAGPQQVSRPTRLVPQTTEPEI